MTTTKIEFIAQLSKTLHSLADLIECALQLKEETNDEPISDLPITSIKFAKNPLKAISNKKHKKIISNVKEIINSEEYKNDFAANNPADNKEPTDVFEHIRAFQKEPDDVEPDTEDEEENATLA